MLQLSKFRRNFGNSDRNPVKFLLPKLVFSESFFTVQLSRCASANPEDDTEVEHLEEHAIPERSLTFRFLLL